MDPSIESSSDFDSCESEEKDLCKICLGEFEKDAKLKPCLCNSFIHKECLTQWLQSSGRIQCEICQYPYRIEKRLKVKRLTEASCMSHFYRFHIFYIYFIGSLICSLLGDQVSFLKYIYSNDEIKCYSNYTIDGKWMPFNTSNNYYTKVVANNEYLNILLWQNDPITETVSLKIILLCLTLVSVLVIILFQTWWIHGQFRIQGIQKEYMYSTICFTIVLNIGYHILGWSLYKPGAQISINDNICPQYIELRQQRNEWLINGSVNFGTWLFGFLLFTDVILICGMALFVIAAFCFLIYVFCQFCKYLLHSCLNTCHRVKNEGCCYVCCKCCFKEEQIILNVV